MTGKDIIKITLNLVIIYVVGGFLLAWVYATTSPIVFQKTKAEKEAALKEMMPEAKSITHEGDWTTPEQKHAGYYAAKDGDKVGGYIAETFGKGYSSYINILVAVDGEQKVKKIKILHHAETPGLGDEVEAGWFTKQFEGKGVEQMKVIKGETAENIQAITGATISSRAATNGVKYALEMLKEKYGAAGGTSHCDPGSMKLSGRSTGAATGAMPMGHDMSSMGPEGSATPGSKKGTGLSQPEEKK